MVWKGLSKFNTEEDSASEASTGSLGLKKPRAAQKQKIQLSLHKLAEELMEVEL